MKLYPYHWRFKKGGKNIKAKVKQFYEDLFSSSSEKYWCNEGNNKRMRIYHKVSTIIKIIKNVFMLGLIIYCLYLSTNTIFCLFDRMNCCNDAQIQTSLVDLKKIVFDTYAITFIMMLFVVFYFSRKNKYSIKKISSTITEGLLFLPISALLTYNFMLLGSLMRSFYLVVVVAVVIFSIESLAKRIDRLYELAVGSTDENKNRKGDNKVCKKK